MSTTTFEDTRGDERPAGPSDADLLLRVREGDADAYGELYLRHEPAASSLARYLTRSNHEADDVVADAFARVLRAIRGGAGPTEAFRPYLLTAVRRTVWRRSDDAEANGRLAASEDEAEVLDLRLAVEPEDRTDEGIVLKAFQALPERWQLVLWHTEIEGQPPAEVAPLLGLSANATAALAVRAREGLRQAYLQAHLQSRPADSCRFSVEHLGSFVRDGLGKRDTAKVEAHLADCHECQELQSDLGSLNKALRSIVGPAVLGAGAAQYLRQAGSSSAGAAGGTEVVDHAHAIAHRAIRFPQAVGVVGAAAALLVTLGVSSDVARPPDRAAADVATVDAATVSDTQLIDAALVGTPAARTPGVQSAPCEGARLPLSLPEGATPTGASLVQAGDVGEDPTTVDPAAASGYTPVASGDATLVGGESACVSDMITPLADAPPDTALVVTYLDPAGGLQALLVPQIGTVVSDAVRSVSDLVQSLDGQLQQYLTWLAAATAGLPGVDGLPSGGPGGVPGGTGTGGVDGVPTVPGIPPVDVPDVPDLPAIPPVTGGGGGVIDDTVDDVGGIVDDVVGGLDDTLGGLLG